MFRSLVVKDVKILVEEKKLTIFVKENPQLKMFWVCYLIHYSFLFLILFFACSDTQTTINEQSNSSSTSVIENLDKTTTSVPETTTSTINENIDEEFLLSHLDLLTGLQYSWMFMAKT